MRTLPRSGAGVSRHSSKAPFASSTARSTSSAAERGKLPSVSPVAGTRDSNVSPEAVLKAKGFVPQKNELMPIPLSQITLSGGRLTQNLGY